MKKFLTLSLLLGSMAFGVSSANAATNTPSELTASASAPQIRVQIGGQNRRNRRQVRRTVTTTRVVRVGRQRFRETIRTTYLPNGRTRTQVIRRVRTR